MKRLITVICIITLPWGVTKLQAQYSAVRTNALGWLAATPNIGLDVAVSPRWSVEGCTYRNPVKTNDFRTTAWGASLGTRYWRFEPHVGSFWGLHAAGGRYDVGGKIWHYEGFFTGLGTSYGYSRLLKTRWNLTAELGIGCFYSQDKKQKYSYPNCEDIYICHYRRVVVAPSRCELSVSYLF